jgi:hypothetical protein
VHRSSRLAIRSLAGYHLSELMTQDGHEIMVNRGQGMLGRPGDGDAFEHGYSGHLSVIGQCENSPQHTAENSSILIDGDLIASAASN